MARLKKKPQSAGPRWRVQVSNFLRYAFLIFYGMCLAGLVWGARSLSRLPEESDKRREEQIQQRLLEKENQRAATLALEQPEAEHAPV